MNRVCWSYIAALVTLLSGSWLITFTGLCVYYEAIKEPNPVVGPAFIPTMCVLVIFLIATVLWIKYAQSSQNPNAAVLREVDDFL